MDDSWKLKALLVLGFLSHLLGTVAAATNPATEYELSIFGSTPSMYWLGIGAAFVAAILVGVYGQQRLRDGAILLAALSGLSIAALPVVRGYYYRGAADSLTHLGFATLIGEGTMAPGELLYPGTHLVTLLIGAVGDVPLPLAFQYMLLLFVGLFLAFVPLAVRAITGRGMAVAIGVFAALLLLPLNQIGTHLQPHPSSQTILYLPLALYLLFAYLSRSADTQLGAVSGVGGLLSLSLLSLVFLHPQEALDMLLVLGAIAGAQYLIRRRRPRHPIARHRPVYGHTLFLLFVFLAWSSQHEVVRQWIVRAATSLFVGGAAATEVTVRTASLQAVGGSLGELFVKLFLVQFVFAIAAGILLLTSLMGRLDETPQSNTLVGYVGVGLVPLTGLFGLAFVADVGDHYFRFFGAIMVFVTVLGAVALSVGFSSFVDYPRRETVRRLAALSFLILLPLSLATIFPSPYIYQPSDHVTEMEVTGYTSALEHRDPSTEFLAIRDAAPRFVDAIRGPDRELPGEFDSVDETAFRSGLVDADPDPRYLAITDRDRAREVVVYGGFRYPESGFQSLEETPGINKVQSNGGFRLYQLRGAAN